VADAIVASASANRASVPVLLIGPPQAMLGMPVYGPFQKNCNAQRRLSLLSAAKNLPNSTGSRQSRSPSNKLEGVESIRKHRKRRETKPLPADRPKTWHQYRLFLSPGCAAQCRRCITLYVWLGSALRDGLAMTADAKVGLQQRLRFKRGCL
jgi:hypothetical protein